MIFYDEFDDWDDYCDDEDCDLCYPQYSDGLDKDPATLVGFQDEDY